MAKKQNGSKTDFHFENKIKTAIKSVFQSLNADKVLKSSPAQIKKGKIVQWDNLFLTSKDARKIIFKVLAKLNEEELSKALVFFNNSNRSLSAYTFGVDSTYKAVKSARHQILQMYRKECQLKSDLALKQDQISKQHLLGTAVYDDKTIEEELHEAFIEKTPFHLLVKGVTPL